MTPEQVQTLKQGQPVYVAITDGLLLSIMKANFRMFISNRPDLVVLDSEYSSRLSERLHKCETVYLTHEDAVGYLRYFVTVVSTKLSERIDAIEEVHAERKEAAGSEG